MKTVNVTEGTCVTTVSESHWRISSAIVCASLCLNDIDCLAVTGVLQECQISPDEVLKDCVLTKGDATITGLIDFKKRERLNCWHYLLGLKRVPVPIQTIGQQLNIKRTGMHLAFKAWWSIWQVDFVCQTENLNQITPNERRVPRLLDQQSIETWVEFSVCTNNKMNIFFSLSSGVLWSRCTGVLWVFNHDCHVGRGETLLWEWWRKASCVGYGRKTSVDEGVSLNPDWNNKWVCFIF